MKTAIVLGTRPEIIKLSPIIKKLNKKNSTIIFTGQHYDFDMSMKFIKELGLRTPEYKMKLTRLQNTTTDRATQTGEVILNLAKIITSINPDTVIVQGDTNTVLASAIASIKCGIPVTHIEAGLRSYDWRMPEEHNRIVVDHISEILFAPTQYTKKNLEQEKVHGKIFVTGNTSIDAVEQNVNEAEKKSKIKLDSDEFVLTTLHRGENVDNKETLLGIMKALLNSKIKIIFPVHPRTIKRLREFRLYDKIKNSKTVSLFPPVGYFEMLYLMKRSKFIISDSGGVQEEASSPKIRKKVLVIRKTTDRPEAVEHGYSELVGVTTNKILESIKNCIKNPNISSHINPYGSGKAHKKIIDILRKTF